MVRRITGSINVQQHDATTTTSAKMEEKKGKGLGIKALFRSSRIYRHSRSRASRTAMKSEDSTSVAGDEATKLRQMEATECKDII